MGKNIFTPYTGLELTAQNIQKLIQLCNKTNKQNPA